MCESKAVVIENGEEKPILDDVALMEIDNDKIILYNIGGKKLVLEEYKLVRIDFIKHKIYLAPK